MKKFGYSLVSHTIYGSFDSGEVTAKDESQALLFARSKIATAVDKANRLLGGAMSIEVDLNAVEVEEISTFNLQDSLEALGNELDGQEIHGLIFVGSKIGGPWHLSFKTNDYRIFCRPFEYGDGIDFGIRKGTVLMNRVVVPCKRPTSDEEFEEWKKFYIGQLSVVQGKFATVKSLELNDAERTYTVEGFLIPKQTISFKDYSDWNSLEDSNGNAILDCQIDCDYDTDFERYQYSFQYVDYNYKTNQVEGETIIDLDDTLKFGGGYIPRDYRSCEVERKAPLVKDDGVYKLIECRNINVDNINYEVHMEVGTNGRSIFEVFPESGEVSEEIRDALDKYVETIDHI